MDMKGLKLLFLFVLTGNVLMSQPIVVDTDRFAFEPNLAISDEIVSPEEYLGYK
jgi:hypothetical protein